MLACILSLKSSTFRFVNLVCVSRLYFHLFGDLPPCAINILFALDQPIMISSLLIPYPRLVIVVLTLFPLKLSLDVACTVLLLVFCVALYAHDLHQSRNFLCVNMSLIVPSILLHHIIVFFLFGDARLQTGTPGSHSMLTNSSLNLNPFFSFVATGDLFLSLCHSSFICPPQRFQTKSSRLLARFPATSRRYVLTLDLFCTCPFSSLNHC